MNTLELATRIDALKENPGAAALVAWDYLRWGSVWRNSRTGEQVMICRSTYLPGPAQRVDAIMLTGKMAGRWMTRYHGTNRPAFAVRLLGDQCDSRLFDDPQDVVEMQEVIKTLFGFGYPFEYVGHGASLQCVLNSIPKMEVPPNEKKSLVAASRIRPGMVLSVGHPKQGWQTTCMFAATTAGGYRFIDLSTGLSMGAPAYAAEVFNLTGTEPMLMLNDSQWQKHMVNAYDAPDAMEKFHAIFPKTTRSIRRNHFDFVVDMLALSGAAGRPDEGANVAEWICLRFKPPGQSPHHTSPSSARFRALFNGRIRFLGSSISVVAPKEVDG